MNPEVYVVLYQSRQNKGESLAVEERLDRLEDVGHIQGWVKQTIATLGRDRDRDEIYPSFELTKIANHLDNLVRTHPAEIELPFYERGEFTGESMESHYQIRVETPFLLVHDNDDVKAAFPSRIDRTLLEVEDGIEMLAGEREWPATELDVTDYSSSGSRSHDAWRDFFIAKQNDLLGEDWNVHKTEASLEVDDLRGDIDIIFRQNGTGDYYLIEIKPNLTQETLDKALGQLLRYKTLFSQKVVGDQNVRLGIGTPSSPDTYHDVAGEAGITVFELEDV